MAAVHPHFIQASPSVLYVLKRPLPSGVMGSVKPGLLLPQLSERAHQNANCRYTWYIYTYIQLWQNMVPLFPQDFVNPGLAKYEWQMALHAQERQKRGKQDLCQAAANVRGAP